MLQNVSQFFANLMLEEFRVFALFVQKTSLVNLVGQKRESATNG